jgi:hypothetical protein
MANLLHHYKQMFITNALYIWTWWLKKAKTSNPEELIRMLVREELRRERLDEIQYTGYGGGFGYTGGGYLTQKTSGGTFGVIGDIAKGVPGIVKSVARNAPTLGVAFLSGKLAWAAASHTKFLDQVKGAVASIKSKFSKDTGKLIEILPPPGKTNPAFLLNFGTEIVKFDEDKNAKDCAKVTAALANDVKFLQEEMSSINAASGMDKLEKMYGLFTSVDVDFDKKVYDEAVKGLTESDINGVFKEYMKGVFTSVADEITGIMNSTPKTKACLSGMSSSISTIRSMS